uniref:Autophagy-related protein n=1 Tax=Rhizophora mucronata TaxID=61149 RepID=A0A2P2MTF1_RHIMU
MSPHCTSESPKCVLTTVSHVEEAIFILVFLIDCRHHGRSWGKNILHKDENSLLRTEFDPLSDHIHKLANSEISRNQISTSIQKQN